ncbi:MAG TPA: hypothetical protein VEF76_04670 [Patescibacteria group bacterium]|nr:hypothetical protein [Patescibacteria group bacterium]
MNEQTELLREMVELLRLMAEPEIAKRDKKRREALLAIVGKSKSRIKAVQLMAGNKTPSAIAKDAGMDAGNFSRFMKSLRAAGVIAADEKLPKLLFPLPPNFPEDNEVA